MATGSVTAASGVCAPPAPAGNSAPRTVLCYAVWWLSASVIVLSLPSCVLFLASLSPTWFLSGTAPTAPSSESGATTSNLAGFKLPQQHPQEQKGSKGWLSCPFILVVPLHLPSCVPESPLDDARIGVSPFAAIGLQSPSEPTKKSVKALSKPSSEGKCRVLQVSAARPHRGPVSLGLVGDSLLGSWHEVARPEAMEKSHWEAPLFTNDRGMLFTKESGFTWKVHSSVFGGSVVAYVQAKQIFPNGTKWWIQQQQQQQQWERVRALKAECVAEAHSLLRHIFFGLRSAVPAPCFEELSTESLTLHNWNERLCSGERALKSPSVVCVELLLTPHQPAALQQQLLAAARTVLQRQAMERVLKHRQPHHHEQQREDDSASHTQLLQQQLMEESCTRVFVSDSLGLGTTGCTGTFSRVSQESDPSSPQLLYFALSVDARAMFLFIESGVIVCGGEAAVPVAVGVYPDTSYGSTGAGAAAPATAAQGRAHVKSLTLNQQQQPPQTKREKQQQMLLLAGGQPVELEGWWLQEGGEYLKQGLNLKCMQDAIQGATPKVCRDLRVQGFRNSLLNGVWRFGGHVNGRPHYVKGINRVDVALAAGALAKKTSNAATTRFAGREDGQGQSPATAAASRVLHLYHTPKGLWVISPQSLEEGPPEKTSTGTTTSFDKTASISSLNKDVGKADASAPTDTAKHTLRRVVAFARSDAPEPPSGIWSLFRTETEEESAVEAANEAKSTAPLKADSSRNDTDNTRKQKQTLQVEINVAKLSCLGDAS